MATAYALIHEEGGVFGISFPDFPGAISTATSPDEVLRKGTEALSFHVAGMFEDGDPLPMQRSLKELEADADYREAAQGAVVALVPFELPGKPVRVNISIDENLLAAIDRAAELHGQSRSAFLAEAAKQRMKGT